MRKVFFYLFVLFTVSLLATPLETAKKLFDEEKNYTQAIEIFNELENNAEADYYLGKAYLYGLGVEKDLHKAFEYAEKSVKQDNSLGINLLGVMYQNGLGVEKDELQALMYYKQAANLGNIKAMKNIADMYVNHQSSFIKKDLKQALVWMNKAYSHGDQNAPFFIALIYMEEKLFEKAIEYLKLITIQKESNLSDQAFLLLGDAYIKINQINNAYENYKKSAELRNTGAILELIYKKDIFKNIMSEEEYVSFLKMGVNVKEKLAYLPLYMYYVDKKYYISLEQFLIDSYFNDKNLEMGCNLSSYYLNLTNDHEINFTEAYKIAFEIIQNNPNTNDIYICYNSLSYLYRQGNYVAQDFLKALEYEQESFKISKDFAKDDIAENIAKIYLESLEDYDNAQKWYQITYDLTKDPKYLSIVDEYKKSKPIYTIDKTSEQQIFPILDNFTKKEQVFTIIESEKYGFLSVNDKSIKMYNKENLELLKEFRAWNGDGILGAFLAMAYDEKNELLYASTFKSDKDFSKNGTILAFDIDTGKVVKSINNNKAIKNTFLAISDDGKYLVAINNENLLNIIDTNTNEIQHYEFNQFGKFNVAKISKVEDDYRIYALSNDNQLFTFSLNQKKRLSKETFVNQISFARNFNNKVNHSSNDLEKIFKHQPMNIQNVFLDSEFLNIKSNLNNYKFDFKDLTLQEIMNFKDTEEKQSPLKIVPKYNNKILEVYNDKNELLSEISLLSVNALKYKILENKYILVVTSDMANMLIFTLDGRAIINLQGFKSLQSNLNYKDGLLISFGDDNVINIFDLKNIDQYSQKEQQYNQETLQGLAKTFGGNPLDLIQESDEEIVKSFILGNNRLGFEATAKQIKSYLKLWLTKKEEIKPLASLYIKNEKDWIIYTSDGLFTYGGDGHKLLKYHQNQGLNKEAKVIENERLLDKFYRPDLIKKILAGDKIEVPNDVKSIILNVKPPLVSIVGNKMVNEKDIDLTYQVCDAGNGVSNTKILINGQAINPPTSRGFNIKEIKNQSLTCKTYTSVHTLSPGKNTISLKAYDKDKNIANESAPLEITAEYTLQSKPNLYLLSIAVSDYKDDRLDLSYAVSDSKSIQEEIKVKSSNIYDNIYTYQLINKEVNSENIEKTFDEIASKIDINDAFILYIAGHGTTQDGLYQFIPYDSTAKIDINMLKQNLSKIVTKKSLVLVDTCESGAALEDVVDKTATVNRLSHDDNRNYIVASSKNQIALEGYKNHGVFTYSILDAFINNDKLKVWGLADHVSEVVPKITQEKFKFLQKPQAKLNENFILISN